MSVNIALPIVRALGSDLERRLRANEGNEAQMAALREFDEALPKALWTEVLSESTAKPSAGYAWGRLLEDTGTNLKTVGILFGAQLTSSLVENLVFSMGGKAYKDSLKALAAALPESTPDDQIVLRPVVKDLASGNPATLLKAATDLATIDDEDLTPEEIYVKNRLKELFTEKRPAHQVNRLLQAVSSAASAYHGYKRNGDSIGYGLLWAFTGRLGLGVALGQGFAKPAP